MRNMLDKKLERRSGQALIMAIIFLLVLTFLGFALVTVATIDIHSSRNLRLAEEALMVAEEGALVGVTYATDRAVMILQGGSVTLSPGTTIPPTLMSTTDGGRIPSDRFQWQVDLIYMGSVACKEGSAAETTGGGSKKAKCALIRSESTGMVEEHKGAGLFGLGQRPLIQQRVALTGRIMSMGGTVLPGM